MRSRLGPFAIAFFLILPGAAAAGDWPTWRFDANRSAASPHPLPAKLYLQWVREYLPLQPAWPDQDKMQFDIVREPVAQGQNLYVNSSRYDAIRALDTRSGADRWLFFADGPVRFAPVAFEGMVYFTSDDGYLYCLAGDTGKLLWKFRGGPSDRKILGNERLISTWPARGAPVIADGKVYFAASIWPFMGIFIHALDARTGAVVWTNDGDGSNYMKQPHNADAFASIAPQGPLVIVGDKLLVPGGRSVPACFDRKTGKLLRYALAENGKRGGGSEVSAMGKIFFNGGAIFDIDSEKYLADYGKKVVPTRDLAFTWNKDFCRVFDLKNSRSEEFEIADDKAKDEKDKAKDEKDKAKDEKDKDEKDKDKGQGDDKEKEKQKDKKKKITRWIMPEVATTKVTNVDTLIKAGARLYFGGLDHVAVLDWDDDARTLTPSWNLDLAGKVIRMIAADDRLFVVTREGFIYCYGGQQVKPVTYAKVAKDDFGKITPDMKSKAEQILAAAKTRTGYAVVWGVGDGRLVEALAKQSQLHLVVVEPSAAKVQAFRERWTTANLYGARIALLPGDAQTVQLPPYLANVMVVENPDIADAAFLARAYQSLRPFGGMLCFASSERTQKLVAALAEMKLANAKTVQRDGMTLIERDGPLPGSANWTHEHADAANTRVSRDVLVKAPMGVLWFGGPSNEGILPRHGHGPQPQVIDGRMLIEGVDLLRAIDIYTGRLLWEAKLPGVGFFYNNLYHQPGANAAGSNFVCTTDGIYVAYNKQCVRLDPATGQKTGEFALPALGPKKETPRWGYINVVGDYLIGGADPLLDPKALPPPPKAGAGDDKDPDGKKESTVNKLFKAVKKFSDNMSASRQLVVMDRYTGKVLWTAAAKSGFRHNATCVGGGRLYTIDRLSGEQLARLKKDDIDPPDARLVAFDLKTGKEVWSTDAEVFGTWLSYSEKHDVLIEAGRVARDSLFDEPKGMRTYRANDGKELWFDKDYLGPAMIHGDMVLQGQGPATCSPAPSRCARTRSPLNRCRGSGPAIMAATPPPPPNICSPSAPAPPAISICATTAAPATSAASARAAPTTSSSPAASSPRPTTRAPAPAPIRTSRPSPSSTCPKPRCGPSSAPRNSRATSNGSASTSAARAIARPTTAPSGSNIPRPAASHRPCKSPPSPRRRNSSAVIPPPSPARTPGSPRAA